MTHEQKMKLIEAISFAKGYFRSDTLDEFKPGARVAIKGLEEAIEIVLNEEVWDEYDLHTT